MTGIPCGIYCRMSVAADGDTVKVDHQAVLCRATAERLGWEVVDVYQDNNASAWKHNRKRPEWDRMITDVTAGRIKAIVVYHGDRLVRQPRDLEDLFDLSRTRGIKLASPTGVRDLNNDEDQFILGIEANMARRESANISRRRKTQYERWRREGKVRPGGRGGRAFGFATDGVTQIPAEADAMRTAAGMILAGEGTTAVARSLAGQGFVTPAGSPFGHTTVRAMLTRPRAAGLMPDGVSEGAWEPVLDRETWESVCAVLRSRAAGYSRASNTRRYLLSGIARCGHESCGAPMQIWQSRARAGTYQLGYRCSSCRRLFRSQPLLDAFIAEAVVSQLGREDNPVSRAPQTPGLATEFRSLTAARAEAAAAIEDPGTPHLPLLLARLERIDARLAALRESAGDAARHRLMRDHAGISYEQFQAEPLQVQRALVSACFEVTVLRASARGPGFRKQDVRLVPR